MLGLLQIAEPGMSTAPHEERFAAGIDLGTTNSLVALVLNGAPEVLHDVGGDHGDGHVLDEDHQIG